MKFVVLFFVFLACASAQDSTAAPETAAPAITAAPETAAPETAAPATTAAPPTEPKCGCLCRYEGCMAVVVLPKAKETCFRFLKACAKRMKCTLKTCNGPLAKCFKRAKKAPSKRAKCIKGWTVCFKKNREKICTGKEE